MKNTPQYKHISHTHCWDQNGNPPCGIPMEKHTQCCLCDLKVPTPQFKTEEINDGRVLRFCSRCGKEWCLMGKILKFGKHYPSFIVKHRDGHGKEIPEDDEIIEAVCRECAKELYDDFSSRIEWLEGEVEKMKVETIQDKIDRTNPNSFVDWVYTDERDRLKDCENIAHNRTLGDVLSLINQVKGKK